MRDFSCQQYKTLYIPILFQLCPNVYNYFSQAEILQAIGEDLGSWFSKHIGLWDLGHFNSKIAPIVRVIKHLDVWYNLLHLPKWGWKNWNNKGKHGNHAMVMNMPKACNAFWGRHAVFDTYGQKKWPRPRYGQLSSGQQNQRSFLLITSTCYSTTTMLYLASASLRRMPKGSQNGELRQISFGIHFWQTTPPTD